MWSVAPLIGAAAALADGVKWATVPVLMAGINPLLIFLASFVNKHAYWKLHRTDYLLGGLSAIALFLWWASSEPLLAIIMAILADAFAAWPSITKSWKYPETESGFIFISSFFAVLTGLATVKNWQFAEYAFLIYLQRVLPS